MAREALRLLATELAATLTALATELADEIADGLAVVKTVAVLVPVFEDAAGLLPVPEEDVVDEERVEGTADVEAVEVFEEDLLDTGVAKMQTQALVI